MDELEQRRRWESDPKRSSILFALHVAERLVPLTIRLATAAAVLYVVITAHG